MSEIGRLDLVVLLETLEKAILSDLLCQSDCEEVDRPLTEGGTVYREASGQISSGWMGVKDAVSVWTRNLRNAGYYPETVLAAVKPALRQAAASLVSKWAVENMIREAAQACIAAYFDPEPTRPQTDISTVASFSSEGRIYTGVEHSELSGPSLPAGPTH